MAALSEPSIAHAVDLRRVSAHELEAVLEEERLAWRTTLKWDFTASADLVRRFVKVQALSGYALMLRGEVIGYSYYVCEDHKGLIGDLYILREYGTVAHEDHLLGAVLNAIVNTPGVRRVEAQLMMLGDALERSLPYARHLQIYPRLFMMADLDTAARLPAGRAAEALRFSTWRAEHEEAAARIIVRSYQTHVDSRINDQYQSWAGAKRFLTNIVQYPGCGSFFGPASFVAEDADATMVGISLASLVAADVGHITQICVAPEAQGTGAGYELMRHSLVALREAGCGHTSLTVTESNVGAVELYRRMGFQEMKHFAAYVWERL